MKTIGDTITTEIRRSVRLEFTSAEIAKILLLHWLKNGSSFNVEDTVVRQDFAAVEDESGFVLSVDFNRVEAERPVAPMAPPEKPCYWTCLIDHKNEASEIRYVFGAGQKNVDATLRRVYPHMLGWTSARVAPTLPAGVKDSECLEVLT